MFQIREYRRVTSLEEAWELNQKKANRIGAGMLWQRMQKKPVGVLIDMSDLGLNQIEETESEFSIGCMVTLRQLEQNEGLNRYSDGAVREAVRHIIGVQFRNLATVGGSIYGRFGFSDVLTLFLALDSYVELYKGGMIPLREFAAMPKDNDILVRVIVKKEAGHFAYESVRTNASTDFPVLTMAGAHLANGELRLAVGARPGRAMRFVPDLAAGTDVSEAAEAAGVAGEATADVKAAIDSANASSSIHGVDEEDRAAGLITEQQIAACREWMKAQVPVAASHRGSAEYRTHLVGVLTGRVLRDLEAAERQDNL